MKDEDLFVKESYLSLRHKDVTINALKQLNIFVLNIPKGLIAKCKKKALEVSGAACAQSSVECYLSLLILLC